MNANKITKTSEVTNLLENCFNELNKDFYNNALPKPIITIEGTNKAYGHYTLYDAWNVGDEPRREINISSYDINRPREKVIATLLHEMTHMYNDLILGVKDCSNRNRYHNKLFKKAAEAHGLICEYDKVIGWSHTSPNEELLEWINAHPKYKDFELVKNNIETKKAKPNKKPNRYKFTYTCPQCGCELKATARIKAICVRCKQQML